VSFDKCPVPGCGRGLGTTKDGEPFAFCKRHYARLPRTKQQMLWQAFRAWKRLEKQRLSLRERNNGLGEKPSGPLLNAIAESASHHLDVRSDCIRIIAGDTQQLEMAQ